MYFLPRGTHDGAVFVFFSFSFSALSISAAVSYFTLSFSLNLLWFEKTLRLMVAAGVFSFEISGILAKTIKLICDYKPWRGGWGEPKSCLCWRWLKVKVSWQRTETDVWLTKPSSNLPIILFKQSNVLTS